MEKTTTKPEPKNDKPRMGRPPQSDILKKSVEVVLEKDFVTIRIPRLKLTKDLLDGLLG